MPSMPDVTDDVADDDVRQVRHELHLQRRIASRRRRPSRPARVRSISAPAAALRSISSCTRAACAAGRPITRPTMPAGAITAMSACTPSPLPRSIVTRPDAGIGVARDDFGRERRERRARLRDPAAPAAAPCARPARAAPAAGPPGRRPGSLQRLVLRSRAPQRDVVAPDVPPDVHDAPPAPRCTRENSPNVTASSTGTPDRDCTCAEIRTSCADA